MDADIFTDGGDFHLLATRANRDNPSLGAPGFSGSESEVAPLLSGAGVGDESEWIENPERPIRALNSLDTERTGGTAVTTAQRDVVFLAFPPWPQRGMSWVTATRSP